MTVEELIEKLKKFDPQTTVCVDNIVDGIDLLSEIQLTPVKRNPGNLFGSWSEYYKADKNEKELDVLVLQ